MCSLNDNPLYVYSKENPILIECYRLCLSESFASPSSSFFFKRIHSTQRKRQVLDGNSSTCRSFVASLLFYVRFRVLFHFVEKKK